MQSRAPSRWVRLRWLGGLCLLLACAGCNLSFVAEGARGTFDGPPIVRIAAPLPDQTFLAGATVIVQARVENAGPDLARVSVLLDEALLGEKRDPNESAAAVLPLTIDWPTSNPGEFTIAVQAERGDGSLAREDVRVNVIPRGSAQPTATAFTAAPALATDGPAANESGMAGRMLQPAPLRKGPGADYDLAGSLEAGREIEILAVNPQGMWYRITSDSMDAAWVYAEYLEPAGDPSQLPVEAGPSAPAAEGVNLKLLEVLLERPVVCNQATLARAIARNDGGLASQTVWVIAEAVLTSGDALGEAPAQAYLKALEPGEAHTVEIPLTLAAGAGEEQSVRVTVDSGDHVPETDETDNSGASPSFVLEQGDCA